MMRIHQRRAWMSQIGLLVMLCLWIAFDPAFELMCERLRAGFRSPIAGLHDTVAYVGWLRPALFCVLIVATVSSFAWTLAGLLLRSPKQMRSLKAWLAVTGVVACWCGLAINASSIAWYGKRTRLAWQIEKFESIVGPLRTQWPDNDGALPEIGPFMAYPFGNPSTLLLLQPPSLSDHGLCISAVDRGESGAIRLQLSGIHNGDWVEWHPEASRPQSFSGGLSDHHQLESSLPLGSGWYLVRYDA